METFYFFPFILLLALSTVYELVFTLLLQRNVNFWFSFYLLLEFYTLSYFFLKLLGHKILWTIFSTAYLVLFAALYFFRNDHNELVLDGYLSAFTLVCMLVYSIMWLLKIVQQPTEKSLGGNPLFYYIGGMLLYLTGTLFLFLMGHVIYLKSRSDFQYFWLLNVGFSFLFRILIIIGIWKDRKI
ncbi:hypothetical protein [Flavobacterium sp.]|uniref:hypothetical protein n=1 Tax=Flavobacterium sp. TaxID=239 RepID=UPI0039E30E35